MAPMLATAAPCHNKLCPVVPVARRYRWRAYIGSVGTRRLAGGWVVKTLVCFTADSLVLLAITGRPGLPRPNLGGQTVQSRPFIEFARFGGTPSSLLVFFCPFLSCRGCLRYEADDATEHYDNITM
jgi:hypothetical protein